MSNKYFKTVDLFSDESRSHSIYEGSIEYDSSGLRRVKIYSRFFDKIFTIDIKDLTLEDFDKLNNVVKENNSKILKQIIEKDMD